MKKNRDEDLAAELNAHLDAHVADNVRAGMTPDEARRLALLHLGGVEPTKERYRDQQRLRIVDACARDIRNDFNSLVSLRVRRQPRGLFARHLHDRRTERREERVSVARTESRGRTSSVAVFSCSAYCLPSGAV